MLTKNRERDDSIALTKSLLIAVQRLYRKWLALSVTFGDTSPKGRGFSASLQNSANFFFSSFVSLRYSRFLQCFGKSRAGHPDAGR